MNRGSVRVRPDDFAANAHETLRALVLRYRTGRVAIYRWWAEIGVEPTVSPDVAFNAADIATIKRMMAESATAVEVAAEIGRSPCSVCRIAAKHGMGPWHRKRPTKPESSPVPRGPKPKPSSHGGHERIVTQRYQRDMTDAGQAADYLRRFGGVWRCTAAGSPSIGGKFWRRGQSVLTDAELIERADWLRRKNASAASGVGEYL